LSVCLSQHEQSAATAAGLLLCSRRAGDIDRLLQGAHWQMQAVPCLQPRDAAEVNSALLTISPHRQNCEQFSMLQIKDRSRRRGDYLFDGMVNNKYETKAEHYPPSAALRAG